MASNQNKISPEELKKNRRMAIILGISASIALISIVFGLVQKGIADEHRVLSDNTVMMLGKSKKIADSLTIQLQQCKEMEELTRKIAVMEEKRADSLSSLLKRKK